MMIPSDRNRCWHSRLGNSFVAGGAITLMGAIAFSENCALAQIQADETLGTTVNSSTVLPCTTSCTIEGGTQVGNNLFHSFSSFSIRDGYIADFLINNHTIANILARVTGGSASDIQGLIRAGENANLFLINPNGIIFGQNAQLDIGGSFVGTTANAIAFPGGKEGEFSLTSSVNPQNSLLSVNPSAFLFNQIADQPTNSIEVKGTLAVEENQSLLLVGGNVSPNVASTGGILIDGGTLQAPGGQVELGGVVESETVGLIINGNNLRLSFPDDVDRADVSLANGAEVDVTAGGGGSIAINARNIDVLQGSNLLAGIGVGLGSVLSQAGNIEIDATEQVTIEGGRIVNNVNFGAFGNAGNIVINTGSLDVNNAVIGSVTSGQGNAGSVTIQTRDVVSFSGSNVLSSVGEQGVGNGADINIQTRSLSLSNGTILGSGTLGQGNSGNIQINASDSISVSSGSILQAFTNGKGNAGNVIIQSGGTVSFDGRGDNGLPSVVASFVGANAVGDGGNVNIQAKTVSLSNGAQIVTSTLGQRNAGSIQINASDSIFVSGSSLQTLSLGEGNAGNIIIQSGNAVSLDGVGADIFLSKLYGITLADLPTTFAGLSDWFSFIEASLQLGNVPIAEQAELFTGFFTLAGSSGKAGDVTIETGRLTLTDAAQVSATTVGEGQGGTLRVTASEAVELIGIGSGLTTETLGSGNAGNLIIETEKLIIRDGGYVSASTIGEGQAGTLSVTASDAVEVAGTPDGQIPSGLSAISASPKKAGNLTITTGDLIIRDRGQVSVSSTTSAGGGSLEVTASSIQLDNQSVLAAQSGSGDGGNITLQARDLLLLRRNSEISTEAGMNQAGGNGGNITIDADFIVAVPQEDSDIVADAFEGNGGNINITTQGIFGIEFREERTPESDITATSEFGVDGVVELNTPDVDPSRGLANLPVEPTEPEVVQSCQPGESPEQSEFVVTGRGGLPPDSQEAVRTEEAFVDLVTLDSEVEKHSASVPWASPTRSRATPIVEATRWIIGSNGEVVLTASVPTVTPYSPGLTPATCSAS